MTRITRRVAIGRGARLGAVGLGVALVAGSAGGALLAPARLTRAQAADTPAFGAWEPSDFEDTTTQLLAPASGALFAVSNRTLRRSDDGGEFWREVAAGQAFAYPVYVVDPTDHTVIYAVVQKKLYRTTDDDATWQELPTTFFDGIGSTVRPNISPVDPSVMFAATRTSGKLVIGRSVDRGETWERVFDEPKSGDFGVRFVLPHPADANRVAIGVGFGGAVPPPNEVHLSSDQGTSWKVERAPTDHAWVGGTGAQAGTFWTLGYTIGAGDPNLRGSASMHSRMMTTEIRRSTDDGVSWSRVYTIGETKFDAGMIRSELAADPTRPGRIFATLPSPNPENTSASTHVAVSSDGGQTWQLAGSGIVPPVYALTVGVDGRMLFAGTERGVWRLALA